MYALQSDLEPDSETKLYTLLWATCTDPAGVKRVVQNDPASCTSRPVAPTHELIAVPYPADFARNASLTTVLD